MSAIYLTPPRAWSQDISAGQAISTLRSPFLPTPSTPSFSWAYRYRPQSLVSPITKPHCALYSEVSTSCDSHCHFHSLNHQPHNGIPASGLALFGPLSLPCPNLPKISSSRITFQKQRSNHVHHLVQNPLGTPNPPQDNIHIFFNVTLRCNSHTTKFL